MMIPATIPPIKVRAIHSSPVLRAILRPNAGKRKSADQLADEIVEEDAARRLQPLGLEDVVDELAAFLRVVVDQHIIIFGPMAYLGRGAVHAAADHLPAVGAARAKAALELGHRGRQDEDADDVRIDLLQLLRALPVDVEQHVAAALDRLHHLALERAVAVAEDVRPFEELAR